MGLLELIIVVLVLAWLLGMSGGFVFGGALHLLLVLVVVVVIIRLLQGREL